MAILSKNQRGYGAGKYGLELDNCKAGWISEVTGGDPVGDVVVEKIGGDPLQKKHIGNLKYEEISFKCGTGMSKALYEWITTGFNQTHNEKGKGRQNGKVAFTDYDFNELSALEFKEAIITEFAMPALDAASKDAAKMTLKFAPETTKRSFSQAAKITGTAYPIDSKKQKQWLPSNFRLTIDGVGGAADGPCVKVNKIEGLTIKQKVTENAVGQERDYQKEATSVETPNLIITFAESHAQPMYDWLQDFVVAGNCGEQNEKTGSLEYLAPDLKTVLFTLSFFNLGIFKCAPDKVEAGNDSIRRVKAEMYCEQIKFAFSAGATQV